MNAGKYRVTMYSPGMVGFGHIRRNASIAQALRSSPLAPAIVMIAEARQAGALPMPEGVDSVTLPALRKEADGGVTPRYLDVSNQELIELRAKVISSAIRKFKPDVLIVDHLPRGACHELDRTLERLQRHGETRCVLGLRDVLQDPATVESTWSCQDNLALRAYYDAIWIYGDPTVFDPLHEYNIFDGAASKVHYTGYLDQRPRLGFAGAEANQLLGNLPPGRLVVCLVGGGHDGAALVEAFAQAELPPATTGVIVAGPYMPARTRQRLCQSAQPRPGLRVLEFVPEPGPLIQQAERVIAMGGYNTMCEVLSFEKHALIVPRVHPKPEQWIRAERMRQLGLIEVLHPDKLSSRAISHWLARDLGPPPPSRRLIDFGGLERIPDLAADLLRASPGPAPQAVPVGVGQS